MSLDDKTLLAMAVSASAIDWPPATTGDPNAMDVFVMARRIEAALSATVPSQMPPKHDGIRLVHFVEQQLIAGTLIRGHVPAVLGTRMARLAEVITENHLELGGVHATVIAALYLWHGCMWMSKLLRPTYAAKEGAFPYKPGQRMEAYAALQAMWMQEARRGDPWVRYGVSLARAFEQERQGDDFASNMQEDWIPKESPYWQ